MACFTGPPIDEDERSAAIWRVVEKTHTTGGREGGTSGSDDGPLDVKLSPGTSGTGTNPEAAQHVDLLCLLTSPKTRPASRTCVDERF